MDMRVPVATLALNPADGTRTVPIVLDPEAPTGVRLTAPGAYPLQLRLLGADDELLDELVTHLLVAPAPEDPAPPLAVALTAQLGLPPLTRPDGSIRPSQPALERLGRLAHVLAAAPGVPVALDVSPETLDVLSRSEEHASILASLREAARTREVQQSPYVALPVDALAQADLLGELDAHLWRGTAVLTDQLGTAPGKLPLVAPDDLGGAGVEALLERGWDRFVIDGRRLSSAPTGGLSLAHRFAVSVEREARPTSRTTRTARTTRTTSVEALEPDRGVEAWLQARGQPELLAQRALAELAVIQTEQPAVDRAVVARIGGRARPEVVASLLAGLRANGRGLLEPTTLDEAFDRASVLRNPARRPVVRDLRPEDPPELGRNLPSRIGEARRLLDTYRSVVGPGSPSAEAVANHILLATGRDTPRRDRPAHLAAAREAIDALIEGIDMPGRPHVTLTARSGSIPLTIINATGSPLTVRVHLESPRLEFPGGQDLALDLAPGTVRADLAVRTLASGAFPLEVSVRSPDGAVELAGSRYTVRSTAFSGVGVVLSVGAGLFLVAWWATHWHRSRRSRRLIPR